MKFYFLLVLLEVFYSTYGKNFVAILAPQRSKILPVVSIARQLEKYNHSVTFVLSRKIQKMFNEEGINVSSVLKNTEDVDEEQRSNVETAIQSPWRTFIRHIELLNKFCHDLMSDTELYLELQRLKFDYALVEMNPIGCFDVFAYKLSLPFIFVGDDDDSISNRVPVNPSFMPMTYSAIKPLNVVMTDRMTFSQRLMNTILYFMRFLLPTCLFLEDPVSTYVPEKQYISHTELKQKSLINILDIDVLLSFPKPIPPHVIYCGGLVTSPAKPLPSNIEAFMQTSKDGVVIVSFGSIISKMSKTLRAKFIDAFTEIQKYNYIFRLVDNHPIDVENVLILSWIPQNDLVGHPKTKLLITHCGQSSINEALYHGIPMICFPIDEDQPENAAIVEAKGYGVSMNILNFSVEDLKGVIVNVIAGNYTDNIQNAMRIFHTRPETPSARAAYWIDVVTKYGNKHFKQASLDMNWYSYTMLDIMAFLILCCALFVLSTKYAFRGFRAGGI